MASYVCLFDWTDQGVKNAADSAERVGYSSSQMAQRSTGRLWSESTRPSAPTPSSQSSKHPT